MANNQGFLTGTGGAASAYTVAATDTGSGVLAQQFHQTYWDTASSTWKTVDTTNRLPVALAGSVTIGATSPTVGNLLVGKDSGGLAKAVAVDTLGQIIISNPSAGGTTGGLTDTQLRATPVPVSLSGSATSALQTAGNASLASIDTKLSGTVAVTSNALTDTQLRATALATSVSNFPATQAVSATALPLPTGASTSANQATGNTSLASIDTKLGGTLAISATALPLPTGAATSANQTATNNTLTSLDGKLTTKTVNSVVSLNTISTLTGAGAGNTNVSVVATAAAVQLASNAANQFVIIQNSNGSAGVLFYGFSAGVNATTGFELKLGELINIPVDNTNRVWLFSTAGAVAKLGWV
jgi:hypothetical protein